MLLEVRGFFCALGWQVAHLKYCTLCLLQTVSALLGLGRVQREDQVTQVFPFESLSFIFLVKERIKKA